MKHNIVQITKSKTRAAILELFFNNPKEEYYLRQLEKLTGYSAGNIRREIVRLEEGGLFLSRFLGNTKLYRLNASHPIYNELKNIIGKTIGIEGRLRELISEHKEVRLAFIYGSFAKGGETSKSDIDIIIVGGIRPKDIKASLYAYQAQVGREINSIVYSEHEFANKLRDKNHFINAVIREPKIFLRGDPDDFRRFAQIRKAAEARNKPRRDKESI